MKQLPLLRIAAALITTCIFFCQMARIEGVQSAKKQTPHQPHSSPSSSSTTNDEQHREPPIGPVVLITGASSGIGLHLVQALLDNDTSVKLIFATSRRPEATGEIKELAEKYSVQNFKQKLTKKVVVYLPMDVAQEEQVKEVANGFQKRLNDFAKLFGEKSFQFQLNTLINNAGIWDTKVEQQDSSPSEEEEPDVQPLNPSFQAFTKHFEVNSIGAVMVTAAFHKFIPAGKKSRIVFISSGMSLMNHFPGMPAQLNTAYGMSKAALNYYMLTINSFDNWLTMAICPGWVETKLGEKADVGKPEERSANNVIGKNPMMKEVTKTAKRLAVVIHEKMVDVNSGKFYSMHEIVDEGNVKELGFVDF